MTVTSTSMEYNTEWILKCLLSTSAKGKKKKKPEVKILGDYC